MRGSMNFDDFIKRLRPDYKVEFTDEGNVIVERSGRSVEIIRRDIVDYTEFTNYFDHELSPYGIGHSDLFPSTKIQNGIRGSMVEPGHPIFGPRHANDSSIRAPRYAKWYPIGPSKNKGKTFEPRPDHFKPPDNDNSFF